ncbi:hypothetical protein BGX27_001661 [Mortierella sp. AM989]|nr:hypothetical protein BGX27_001661 [Mortierella sp. AM989]
MSPPQFGVRYDSDDPVLRSIAHELGIAYSIRDQQSAAKGDLISPFQRTNSYDFQLDSFQTRPKVCMELFPPHVQRQRYEVITAQERLILISIGQSTTKDDVSNQKEGSTKCEKNGSASAVLIAGLEVLEYHLTPIAKSSANNNSGGSSDNTPATRSTVERIIYIAKVDTSGSWPLPGVDSRGLKSPTHALVKGYLKGMRSIESLSPPFIHSTLKVAADQLSSLVISSGEALDTDKDLIKSLAPPRLAITKTSLYIFARAQPQYLFADSAKNPGKHVLDDRGLVRWWKNMVASVYSDSPSSDTTLEQESQMTHQKSKLQGYWHVPGVESERGALRIIQSQSSQATSTSTSSESVFKWTYGYPDSGSKEMANILIPQFPDDPKSRLMRSPSGSDGYVSISTFWELAAIAEESGAGKITGFFRVTEEEEEKVSESQESQESQGNPSSKESDKSAAIAGKESEANSKGTTKNYTKIINFLLGLDFSTLECARDSSKQWRHQVNMWKLNNPGNKEAEIMEPSKVSWIQQLSVPINLPSLEETETLHITTNPAAGVQHNPLPPMAHTLNPGLIKRKEPVSAQPTPVATTVNVLNASLIKRKAPQPTGAEKTATASSTDTSAAVEVSLLSPSLIKRKAPQMVEAPAINVLNHSLIKRKAAIEPPTVSAAESMSTTEGLTTHPLSSAPVVNILGSNLIKKKQKVDS